MAISLDEKAHNDLKPSTHMRSQRISMSSVGPVIDGGLLAPAWLAANLPPQPDVGESDLLRSCAMPHPWNERQALEEERDELAAQMATDQRELAATTDQDRTRREFLVWRIKRAQNRITFIEIRLAAIRIEAP